MKLTHLLAASLWLAAPAGAALFYPGVSPTNRPWPGGVVPYLFDTNYPATAGQQAAIVNGMKDWSLGANVTFLPRTTQTQYLLIRYQPGSGIDSVTGTAPVIMTLDNLRRAQINHETGHALGLQHEHVRPDRTNHIAVLTTNLQPAAAPLYAIETNGVMSGAYDYDSVMSYSRTLFSLDPATRDVLVPLGTNFARYYQRIGALTVSPGDLAGLAALYGPAPPLTNVVTHTGDTGPGSLRAALLFANGGPGRTVTFNLPTSDPGYSNGVWTIRITGFLPVLLADGTVIDATTQPGYTNRPVVFLRGDSAPAPPDVGNLSAFYVYAANTVIRGFALGHFNDSGVFFLHPFATNNALESSFVGLHPDGSNRAPNQIIGVRAEAGSTANRIGGTNAAARNVISGNVQYGVWLGTGAVRNAILGNFIGTDAAGQFPVSNGLSGVALVPGATSNTIGGAAPGAGNLISGNAAYGIGLFGPVVSHNTIQGNLIGLNAAGSQALPNGLSGIGLFGAVQNTLIGGTNAATRNVISGNGGYGIQFGEPGCASNTVAGNFIGTSRTATQAVPNAFSGLGLFDGPHHNTIGPDNLVSGNLGAGVQLGGNATRSNMILGNLVGLASNGLSALGNTNDGIVIQSQAAANTIGGTNTAARNVVSGNGGNGITLTDPGTAHNQILGNFCGLNRTGSHAVPNTNAGVSLVSGASSNLVGSPLPGAGNVLSGNHREGIFAGYPGTADNVIQGNLIGTGPAGTNAIPNHLAGLALYDGPVRHVIGGDGAARNIISGNLAEGVFIGWSGTTDNLVHGNVVGLGTDGTTPIGNGYIGIHLYSGAAHNTIGGGIPNVVSANNNDGIALGYAGTSSNRISGNFIGTGPAGLGAFGNSGSGISLYAGPTDNVIGLALDGSGQGNTIAWNGWDGVTVYDTGTTGNPIRGNLVYSNGPVGFQAITLVGNGGNDALDADDGPNRLQNHPVLTNAVAGGNWTALRGTLSSAALRDYIIDFYRSPTTDDLVHAEAHLGSATFSTDPSGHTEFLFLADGAFPGERFTATATDRLTGDTSELSPAPFAATATNGTPRPAILPAITHITLLPSQAGAALDLAPATTGFVYRLEWSSNLLHWITATNVPGGVPFQFVDPTARPRAFYRTVWP